MCTLSLLPLDLTENSFVLTSNRDEAPGRKTRPPAIEIYKEVPLLFPKDMEAGGTWIGISQKKHAISLMNGAFKPHKRKSNYRLSRGVVVKDLLASADVFKTLESYDFNGIEAFTLVMVNWDTNLGFTEVVWDEERLHLKELQLQEHIWSSSPLYDEQMKQKREAWFSEFRRKNKISPEAMLGFHHSAGIGDKSHDLIMDRGFVKTKSISQIIVAGGQAKFWYKDLEREKVYEENFKF